MEISLAHVLAVPPGRSLITVPAFSSLQRLVITVAVLASFVTFLDGTVVTVALPAIKDELGGGITTQQWVVDAYLITLSALILLAGSLSDAYGRVRIMRIGLIAFGIASVAVAAAPEPLTLIIARALQGAAGALLVPSSLALIMATMRGELQSRAIGVWTAFTTGAQIAGPLLGGLFVDLLSWRFVFLINVIPIGITLILLARLHLPDQPRGARVDWWSGMLCAVGLGAVVFALIEQPNFGWGSPAIWIPGIAGVALFVAFLMRQPRSPAPLMPLSLFNARNFAWGNLATLFIYAALSLNGFVIGVYLQEGAGLPATVAGLASLPITVLMILLSSQAGSWAGKLGPRLFMTVGPLLMAAGAPRTAMSMLVSVEKPAITVPTVKRMSETCTRILRSMRSASLPQIGVETAVARRLAVMTQVYWDCVPPRSAMMTGSDVDTIVPESTATNMPTMRPDIAVKTSRAERLASGAEEVWEVKCVLLRKKVDLDQR